MSGELVHATVLLEEAVDALQIKADGIYVDGTFGRGGHSRLILQKLGATGRLIAFDKDPMAIKAGAAIEDPRFQLVHVGFEQLNSELDRLGIKQVDGVLLDLGVSSPQLDDAQRGFSFRFDAPLDMRMDTSAGQTAAQWLATAEESLIAEVIRDYGEVRFARQIAKALVVARQERTIDTTKRLTEVVAQVVRTREPGKNPATRTFQAIRIYLNRELEALESVLPQSVARLRTGGRLVIISFHSLEDRIVKRFMRDKAQGDKLPKNIPVRAMDIPLGEMRLIGKAVTASAGELERNPRARSAVMRVAERVGA